MRSKPTKQAQKLENARSSFERWLIKNGLRQQEAADLLGLQRRQIVDYARGISQNTGKPISPSYSVRVLMRILDEGIIVPEAWPE